MQSGHSNRAAPLPATAPPQAVAAGRLAELVPVVCGGLGALWAVVLIAAGMWEVGPAWVAGPQVTASSCVLLLLTSLALLAFALGSETLGITLTSLALLVSTLSLIQYIPGLEFGLDQAAAARSLGLPASPFRRLPPNVAVAFLTLSLALLIREGTPKFPDSIFISAFCALIAMAIGALAAYGYIIGAQAAIGWGRYTSASPQIVVAILAMSIGTLLFLWHGIAVDDIRFRGLWRSLMFFSVSWLLLISLLSASFGILPLAERLIELQPDMAAEALGMRISWIALGSTMIGLVGSAVLFLFLRVFYHHFLRLQSLVMETANRLRGELSARVEFEEQLHRALQEKEALLKEVHHRVKNNLQVISSLLRMQLRRTETDDTRSQLEDTFRRIQSIALLHQILCSSERISEINLKRYIEELVASVRDTDEQRTGTKILVNGADVFLTADQALPCGLIVSELITNALHHAFTETNGGGEPQVSVSAEQRGENITIKVRDNGVGIPADLELKRPRSLGLRLINMLSNQLRGEVSFARDHGTTCTISFPKEETHGQA